MEAIRAQTTPALAVLDWMMPRKGGLQICRRVREANKVLYIILLTARGGKERLVEGLQAGADDYLMKPFDKDELRARAPAGRLAHYRAAHDSRRARAGIGSRVLRDSLFEDAVHPYRPSRLECDLRPVEGAGCWSENPPADSIATSGQSR